MLRPIRAHRETRDPDVVRFPIGAGDRVVDEDPGVTRERGVEDELDQAAVRGHRDGSREIEHELPARNVRTVLEAPDHAGSGGEHPVGRVLGRLCQRHHIADGQGRKRRLEAHRSVAIRPVERQAGRVCRPRVEAVGRGRLRARRQGDEHQEQQQQDRSATAQGGRLRVRGLERCEHYHTATPPWSIETLGLRERITSGWWPGRRLG